MLRALLTLAAAGLVVALWLGRLFPPRVAVRLVPYTPLPSRN